MPKNNEEQGVSPVIEPVTIIGEQDTPKLVAFGRFVKPEMYDVFGDYDLSDVRKDEKLWLVPNKIAPIIFDNVYSGKPQQIVNGLALSAHEYNLLARYPNALAQAAMSRTLSYNDINQERIEASQRAKKHVFDDKREKMSEHLSSLETRRSDIKELRREARTPGYAHKTPERMTELLSGAWQEFQIILDVLHVQRGWNDEMRKRAEATMIHNLTQGGQATRVGHWKAMLELTDNYLGARVILFKDRIKKTTLG